MAARFLAASARAQSTVTEFVTVTAGAAPPSAPAEAVNSTSVSSTAAPTATAGAGNGTAAAPGNNKNGFSRVDLNAAVQGGLTNATAPTAANSIGLRDEYTNDVGYIATLQLGTPPRNVNMLMDSGSVDLWVGGEACKFQQGGGCGNHTFLGTQSSSSFKSLGQNFQVTYGTGQVKGDIITDDVVVAGLKLPAHTFGVAAEESVDFSSNDMPFDGLVSLAQSILANQTISRLADGKNDGEITFGGIDQTKIDPATLTTIANVNKIGFWEVPFTPSVGGKDLGLSGRTAILDTGTSLIIAPSADALALH
ncbi:hypothetical protein FRC10_011354 [Ceratobasidium sp. 414]|nr:hypothetical protein FRC10_011354 [Ceratobasidium sp. 414]